MQRGAIERHTDSEVVIAHFLRGRSPR